METLRIAIFSETIPRSGLTLQPWRYLGELARALQDQGHETTALTSQEGIETWNGVRVQRHPHPVDFRSARGLRRLLDGGGYDAAVVRLTATLFFSMRGARRPDASKGRLIGIFLRPLHSGPDLIRRFLDPSLIPEIRLDVHHVALYASRQLGRWTDAPSFVDDYVFLWDSDRESGVSAGLPTASCRVVRHPFDPFFMERKASGVGPRLSGVLGSVGRRIVFSGPPEATRGFKDVIALAHVLPPDPPTQVFLLLRDRRFREPIVRRERIGRHEVVGVHGLVSREELRAVYQASEVAVFPYRFVRTGLPLVALEAVASGLPVVTTRVHPIRELEGRTGLVFAKPRNPRDLARAVRWVLEDDRREEIRRQDEEWIRSTPDWRATANAFVSLVRRPTSAPAGEGF